MSEINIGDNSHGEDVGSGGNVVNSSSEAITQVTNDDIIDISLKTGTVHRSFTDHILVVGDKVSMSYGVRITYPEADSITVPNDTAVTGYFIRPDHNTVVIEGQHFISGNRLIAVVELPQECYAYAGQFVLVIKLSMSTCDTTVRIVDGTIVESAAGGTVVPGTPIMSIDQIVKAVADASAQDGYQEGVGIYFTGGNTINLRTPYGHVNPQSGHDDPSVDANWTSIGEFPSGSMVFLTNLDAGTVYPVLLIGGSSNTIYGTQALEANTNIRIKMTETERDGWYEVFLLAIKGTDGKAAYYFIIPHKYNS